MKTQDQTDGVSLADTREAVFAACDSHDVTRAAAQRHYDGTHTSSLLPLVLLSVVIMSYVHRRPKRSSVTPLVAPHFLFRFGIQITLVLLPLVPVYTALLSFTLKQTEVH